jgi:hypothetical protein
LPDAPWTKDELQKAYREAAKRWHPDRFESEPELRREAEERFKRVQAAYRALSEHFESPVDLAPATLFTKAADPAPFNFGGAPGCFTAPYFPADVEQIIRDHLGREHTALAMVDLAKPGSQPGSLAQFVLLADHAVMVRNDMNIVSLLWYTDLGEVTLSDRRRNGKLSFRQQMGERFLGPRPNYTLKILRRNGAAFATLAAAPDDSVKRVLYNFLLRKKHEKQPQGGTD